MSILPLCLIILAAVSVPIAALIPISNSKGRVRLAGSLLLGTGFILMGVVHVIVNQRYWLLVIGGGFLIWVGLRKYRRDPQGRTSSAAIL